MKRARLRSSSLLASSQRMGEQRLYELIPPLKTAHGDLTEISVNAVACDSSLSSPTETFAFPVVNGTTIFDPLPGSIVGIYNHDIVVQNLGYEVCVERGVTRTMSPDEFERRTGRHPDNDDLERVNCAQAGQPGHGQCGWCTTHDSPRFQCGCILRINDSKPA